MPGHDLTTAVEPQPVVVGHDLYCPQCGYNIHNSQASSCPECGAAIDEQTMRLAQVPWQNRREVGRIKAFLKTCWRVVFQTKRFCHAVGQPVSLKDAVKFRRIIIAICYLPMLLVGALVLLAYFQSHEGDQFLESIAGWELLFIAPSIAMVIGGWLFFEALTAVHTYWFAPRHLPEPQRLRSLALSHYAGVPALVVVGGIWLFVLMLFLARTTDNLGLYRAESDAIAVGSLLSRP